MKVIVRSRLRAPAPPAGTRREEPELFSVSLEPRRSFAASLLLSVAFHGVLAGASMKVAQHFRETGWNAVLQGYTVEPIRVLVPERLYFSRTAKPGRPRGKRLNAARRPAAPSQPAPVRVPLEGPLIIQPQPGPIALSAALRVAGVLSWSARVPEQSKRAPARPIVPGQREEGAVGQIAAPPRLDIPNRELRFTDINIAAAPQVEKPALPVSAGGTSPVQIASEEKEAGHPNTLDAFRRDPANLLILGANAAARNEVFTVPPGTRMGDGAPASGEAAASTGASHQAADATSRQDGTARPEAPTSALDRTAARTATATEAKTAAAETKTAAGEAKTAAGASNGAAHRAAAASLIPPPGALAPGASPAPALPPAIRRTNPSDGKFDIVILQSSPSENFAEAGASLAGRPVYSVYLHVGTARAWVLQFCLIPTVKRPTAETTMLVLGKAERVDAPYPLSTAVPAGENMAGTRHTLFHGYLTATGRFRDLRPVSGGDARAQHLMSYLQEWEFRPAARDGEPVDVEVLLAVPPNGL